MVTVCWSVKGGTGLSVVAAALALGAADVNRRAVGAGGDRVLLVDLAGDAGSILGQAEADGPGVRDWLAVTDVGNSALDALTVPVVAALALLPAGHGDGCAFSVERLAELSTWLGEWPGPVVVDAGTDPAVRRVLNLRADRSLLVLRLCYLAIQSAVAAVATDRADEIVVVEESGRSLTCADVVTAIGVPVAARVPVDPSISRAVDAGLITSRLPRLLARSLRPLIDPHPVIRVAS